LRAPSTSFAHSRVVFSFLCFASCCRCSPLLLPFPTLLFAFLLDAFPYLATRAAVATQKVLGPAPVMLVIAFLLPPVHFVEGFCQRPVFFLFPFLNCLSARFFFLLFPCSMGFPAFEFGFPPGHVDDAVAFSSCF